MGKITYHAFNQLSSESGHTYKLIQLPPDVLSHIEHGSEPLQLKSSPGELTDLTLCTNNKSWRIRQMNHSNTVFLLNDLNINCMGQKIQHDSNKENESNKTIETLNMLMGFASNSFEYELTSTPGSINADRLPIYDGNEFKPTGYSEKDLLLDSPVSKNQFYKIWYDLCGCEVHGSAVILSRKFVTDFLSVLIPVIISIDGAYSSEDYNLEVKQILELLAKENELYTPEICWSIFHKFGDVHEGKFKLKNIVITRWFGIQALSRQTQPMDCKQFLLLWKGSLPHFYNVPLDLEQLKGYYFKPTSTLVQYLEPSSLSHANAGSRIKELFLVSKEWDLDDFIPFIQEFIPTGKKPDSIILKYAKKKRMGKNRFVVCPR